MPQYANLNQLAARPYIEQAKWYLNGFWESGAQAESENVWNVYHKFVELDPKKKAGTELDKVQSLKLMESQGMSVTASELNKILKEIDTDGSGGMALIEYLAYKYGKTPDQVINSPQGSQTLEEEVNNASAALAAVSDSLSKVQSELASQTQALADSKAAEDKARNDLESSTKAAHQSEEDKANAQKAEVTAKSQMEEQKAAEDKVRASEKELQAAIDDIKNQESSTQKKIEELTAKAADESLSAVQRNKANAELGQLKSADQGPLRQAKIAQESVLKQIQAKRSAAESATAQATASHASAEKAARQAEQSAAAAATAKETATASAKAAESKRAESEASTKKVEASQKETEGKLADANAKLAHLKSQKAVAHGAVWWMEREIIEAEKYMPKKR